MRKSLFDLGVPFLGGGVIFLLVAFGTGAITATNTSTANVAMARIDERAAMCQEAALAYLAETGKQVPADRSGTEARDLTKALADKFFLTTGDVTKDKMIKEACSSKLNA